MSQTINASVIFNEYVDGYPDPEKTLVVDKTQNIDIDNVSLAGGILVKLLVISVDPYWRVMMDKVPKVDAPTFQIGKPIVALGVGKVIRSENSNFRIGELFHGGFALTQYSIIESERLSSTDPVGSLVKVDKKANLPLSPYVGVAGMAGKTAYYGYKEYVKPFAKRGDTIFITTGAGPVGSLVIQLAKADGLRVIASAGSDDKVKFMKECGADVAFNYKTISTQEILDKNEPLNFFWDHVGGEILDAAFLAAAYGARFIICGAISAYNKGGFPPLKNFDQLVWKHMKVSAFGYFDLENKYVKEFFEEIPARLASGEIKYLEDKRIGLESVGQLAYDVQTGKNFGKAVVVVADADT